MATPKQSTPSSMQTPEAIERAAKETCMLSALGDVEALNQVIKNNRGKVFGSGFALTHPESTAQGAILGTQYGASYKECCDKQR